MTVAAHARKKSATDFFNDAYNLSDKISKLLIRDFGIKRISRDLKNFTYKAKMTPEDQETYITLCTKYHIDVESEYPLWLLEYYRNWILEILKDLINAITQANSIYPSGKLIMVELQMRVKYQYQAIGCCYQLKQALQAAGRNLPVDYNKFMPYVGMIDAEIKSLKAWKKADKKRFLHQAEEEDANPGNSGELVTPSSVINDAE